MMRQEHGELVVTTTDQGGTSNDISVVVTADNTDALRQGAEATQALLAGVPGLSEVSSDLMSGACIFFFPAASGFSLPAWRQALRLLR